MHIITRQLRANGAPLSWRHQYSHSPADSRQRDIMRQLDAMSLPVDPDEVDRIIGNKSWTDVGSCDECEARPEILVEVGQEPDYESATACLCRDCLAKAVALIDIHAMQAQRKKDNR